MRLYAPFLGLILASALGAQAGPKQCSHRVDRICLYMGDTVTFKEELPTGLHFGDVQSVSKNWQSGWMGLTKYYFRKLSSDSAAGTVIQSASQKQPAGSVVCEPPGLSAAKDTVGFLRACGVEEPERALTAMHQGQFDVKNLFPTPRSMELAIVQDTGKRKARNERHIPVNKEEIARIDTVKETDTLWRHDTSFVQSTIVHVDTTYVENKESHEESHEESHALRNGLIAGGTVVALAAVACAIWCRQSQSQSQHQDQNQGQQQTFDVSARHSGISIPFPLLSGRRP